MKDLRNRQSGARHKRPQCFVAGHPDLVERLKATIIARSEHALPSLKSPAPPPWSRSKGAYDPRVKLSRSGFERLPKQEINMKVKFEGVNPDGTMRRRIAGLPWDPYTIVGTYKRKNGLRRTYEYEAEWHGEEQGTGWEAVVRHEGELKGTLGGLILTGPATPREVVILAVETSIEDLIGMVE